MFKQIFTKKDGKPKLTQSVYNDERGVEEFHYDDDLYTDIMPPSNLYEPIHYNEEKEEWEGVSYDDWIENLNDEQEEEEYTPNEVDKELGLINIQVFKTQREIADLQQDFAELVRTLSNDKKEE